MTASEPEASPAATPFEARLRAAFERGDFASVRNLARAAEPDHQALAEEYLRRTQPAPAVRFALTLTLLVIAAISVYYTLIYRRG